jgi:hypothetical protein
MDKVTVLIISTDDGDWEGIYVDGILFEEGHSLSNKDFINLINRFKNFEKVEQKWISSKEIEKLGGSFPAELSDIS